MSVEGSAIMADLPRLVVAGLSGESGKTLVSLALLLEAGRRGIPVRAFKKGPDYIDSAWLEWASQKPARNLDTYLMGFDRVVDSFASNAVPGGFNLVEGNRGLYDGGDARGTHSTAELAKALRAPVLLVVNATKVTRTAAALVLGCQRLDPVAGRLDFDRLMAIARQTPPVAMPSVPLREPPAGDGLTIGYLDDAAFSFYYPENPEALRAAGAKLAAISALTSDSLPPGLDALYIGGGFPETHAETLSENSSFLASIRHRARAGLPVYAECGGLMLLSRALTWRGSKYEMAGVLGFDVEVCDAPQGHGYAELVVDTANPFFPIGTRLRGHEFHYSRMVLDDGTPSTACAVDRGMGCLAGRDAVVTANVWAAYTHLHALGTPQWARAILSAARGAHVVV
jgi:cobyrinic acid a,c-diamide synthase